MEFIVPPMVLKEIRFLKASNLLINSDECVAGHSLLSVSPVNKV